MTDYIRKAVELADGWSIYNGQYSDLSRNIMATTVEGYRFYLDDQILLDYLAAQLVRQVDAKGMNPMIQGCLIEIYSDDGNTEIFCKHYDSEDRTMNTIRAIVDSGVLGDKE